MLVKYLKNFGKTYHIHSRKPPRQLTTIGKSVECRPHDQTNVYREWFTKQKIPKEDLHKYTVIFIYRNPIQAIYSRFSRPLHLLHIQCKNPNIKIIDVADQERDLYRLSSFFHNYTSHKKRNYPIYCVKFENFFSQIKKFNQALGLPDDPKLYPQKYEKMYKQLYKEKLKIVYQPLIDRQNRMPFLSKH